MADVRSKNLYELLGNDPELDPNREPEPPTRALDKPVPRHGKRDAPKEAPSRPTEGGTPRRGGRFGGNEAAFRDRNAGSRNNREKPVEEAGKESNNRFDRGGRPPRRDRQSRTGQTDTRKQVNQGWGNQDGEKTWDDEKAGENIAQGDETEPQTPAEEKPEEPVDKSKSYSDYLAEKAAREDLSAKPVRAANEGAKVDKKWAGAKEFKRDEDEEAYIKGKEEKNKREKQRKEKNFLDVDMRFVEAPRGGSGASRGRGGRGGRGAGRGDRGAPRDRPAGRGGRGNGPRSERPAPVTVDEKNFPSLGSK
ncbi:putative telomere and ribosome associated protein Stm1 [Aspergillus lucknowensis]|uniref:Telomere and ribosome associated protein Stm1 n=1 Tax=Aspergillus lucknowensis TaxID=176173 RepID=A0ABR4LUM2_9EURO